MIENGYIKYLNTETYTDEDGNPIDGGGEWSDFIPACIEGSKDTAQSKSESGIRYDQSTYTVYFRRQPISGEVRLYTKEKTLLGEFSVRSVQVSPIVNETRITV